MNNAGEAPLVPRVLSGVLSRARRTREARRRERPWDGMGGDLGEGRDVALPEGGRAPGGSRHHAERMPGEGFLATALCRMLLRS